MAIPTNPNDIGGANIQLLGKLRALDMTATAVYDWLNNGPNTVLVFCHVLRNFSAFPDGSTAVATWAYSFGTNSSTTPNNMRAAATAAFFPVVSSQSMNSSTITAYVPPRTTVYFAITTATNGVGTFDAELYGAILAR